MRKETLVTCFHEAGHAALAMAFGYKLLSISIAGPGKGRTEFTHLFPISRDNRLRLAVIAGAGAAAEAIANDQRLITAEYSCGHFNDMNLAKAHMQEVGIDVDFRFLIAVARELLLASGGWNVTCELAKQLDERRLLDHTSTDVAFEIHPILADEEQIYFDAMPRLR